MSLLRTAGRVAVASSVHGNVQRRQQQRFQQQDQQQAQAAAQQAQAAAWRASQDQVQAFVPQVDPAERIRLLTELAELRKAGILTEVEFEAQKAVILAS